MKRRTLLCAAGTLSLARPAFASERSIGWITAETRETSAPFFNAFKAGLQATPGGAQIRILDNYVTTGPDAMAGVVRQLEQQRVGLIVSQGATVLALARINPTVPVVFGYSGDPVVAGIVQSLARPGGNFTGVSFMSVELNAKRIDLLRTALPQCRKVGLLSTVQHHGEEREIAACQQAVERSGIELVPYRINAAAEVPAMVARALDEKAEALLVLPSAGMVRQAAAISAQCLAQKVPVLSGWASMVRSGVLLTYGPNQADGFKQLAPYVMRILAGAKPSDLPVEQPSVFELVINMKIATALGITLPPTLLALANEIIE